MAQIDGLRIQNYKALKDITLGKLWYTHNEKSLTKLTALIGKNGTGKSSVFDALGFISDCLKKGAEGACDERGGFARIFSKGQSVSEGMNFEICYRERSHEAPVTYEFSVKLDDKQRPFVSSEILRQKENGKDDSPSAFLIMHNGSGIVWKGAALGKLPNEDERSLKHLIQWIESEHESAEANETEIVRLENNRQLAITVLGAFKQHPRIAKFRKFIAGWYLSDFSADYARSLPVAGGQKHLNARGDNLANVVQFMQRDQPERCERILHKISKMIPGVNKIATQVSSDGRLLLEFYAQGFDKPFFAQQMSDGTLKLLFYMLLLEDPELCSLVCIEAPENGLHHKLLESLADEFRNYASDGRADSQVFITTHQPFLLNALNTDEVWILEKQEDGFSKAARVSNNELANNMAKEGLLLGDLWYSGYLSED